MDAAIQRQKMVRHQLESRGIRDLRVLNALRSVPRENFVPDQARQLAYEDHPLGIGNGQTISQPYIVALMTELLKLPEHAIVLEIGAGCGYQSAILAQIADRVCAIERIPVLAAETHDRLVKLGYHNVDLRCDDGFHGWPGPEKSFDGILVACAPPKVPERLAEQLRPGARLIVPIGPSGQLQHLTIVTRSADGAIRSITRDPVRFVPMLHD